MKDIVKITSDIISLDEVAKSVHDPKAGAISTFSGTTRDNFEGIVGRFLTTSTSSFRYFACPFSKALTTHSFALYPSRQGGQDPGL